MMGEAILQNAHHTSMLMRVSEMSRTNPWLNVTSS